MSQTVDAQGDFERTAHHAANASKELSGRIENLKTDLGAGLQSVSESFLAGLNTAVIELTSNIGLNQESLKAWAEQALQTDGVINNLFKGTGEGLATSIDLLGLLRAGWAGLSGIVQIFALTAIEAISRAVKGIDALLAAIGQGETGLAQTMCDLKAEYEKALSANKKTFNGLFSNDAPGYVVRNFFGDVADGAAKAAGAAQTAAKAIATVGDATAVDASGAGVEDDGLGDAVGLSCVAQGIVRNIPPRRNPAHLTTVYDILEQAQPKGETQLAAVLHELAETVRQRALCVIISDLFVEPELLRSSFQHLRFRKHDVAVFHLLDPREISFDFRRPMRFVDMEGGPALFAEPNEIAERYHKAIKGYLDDLHAVVLESAVDYHRVSIDEDYEQVLMRFLVGRARSGGAR